MRTARPSRRSDVGPPSWTVPLAMLLCGLFAVAVGTVGAMTGGWIGGPAKDRALRISGNALLQQRPDGPIVLCLGASGESRPAVCSSTVAVTGVSWSAVSNSATFDGTTEGWAMLTGMWSKGILAVEAVEAPRLATPTPVQSVPDQLCIDAGGTPATNGTPEVGPDPAVLESIPGFQGYWVTDGGTPSGGDGTEAVHNVAVQGDVDRAQQIIREHYNGPLCVGTIPGATRVELSNALTQLGRQFAELGLLSGKPSLVGGRAGLDLVVLVVTPEVERRIELAVGPDVAPWTTVRGQFHVVD